MHHFIIDFEMKIEVRQILSLKLHQASCHLLIMGDVYILLDCGISSNFDFSLYRGEEAHLKKVSLILISHPSIQYLGALPFILTQFNIHPQIYATKPVSQLGPLNIHEALLSLRHPKYTPEVYSKICLLFEDSVVKPLQRVVFRLGNETDKKQQSADSIYLTCYNSGNALGSVCWRISYFMFNCLYLVGYNNYNQYHLQGLDVETIVGDRTDLLITDCYEEQPQSQGLRRENVKKEVEKVIQMANSIGKDRLIFSCYENQRMIELVCILILLNQEKKVEGRIDFIHPESLYLQTVKIYPELEFKMNEMDEALFNTRFLIQRKSLSKIVVTTGGSTQPQGILWPQLCALDPHKTMMIRMGQFNPAMNPCLDDLKELFQTQKPEPPPTTMEIENVTQADTELKQNNIDIKEIRSDPYIYNNGTFPRFKPRKEYIKEFDAFGEQYDQPQMEFIEETVQQKQPELLKRKSSLAQDRKKIVFQMPPVNQIFKLSYDDGIQIRFNGSLTNFQSSANIISRIKAEKNLFINCDAKDYTKYEIKFKGNDKKMETVGIHKKPIYTFEKPYEVIDLPVKLHQDSADKSRINQSAGPLHAIRVNGELVQSGDQLEIWLQKAEEKELREFNMARFYKSLKGIENTRFNQNGTVEIGGIKMSQRKGQISIEGVYSNEYYKLRQMLYDYIQSS